MAQTGSGATTIVYNTRERLISTDPNRAQAISARQLADVLRYFLDAQSTEDVAGGGVEVMGTGTETPLRGTILGGIRPRPDIGTTNLFVEPGVALLIDNPTPASSDDSIGAYVVDPGVQVAGALTLTPGSGSTRIDVVECQRATNVFESDNRDVFNPSTGLFTPTQVTKVAGGQLVYRIRTGTPGSGFPGVAAGWLPLMVASVPSSATNWDAVTCWDVRPLASDRISGPFQTSRLLPSIRRSLVYCDATTSAAHPRIWGEVDLDFGGYRAGGVLQTNSTTNYVDPTDSNNQQSGFAMGTTGALWGLWLVFPFGLPRWVRYSDAGSGGRKPSAQRGIVSISNAQAAYSGLPLGGGGNSVATPPSTGLNDPATANAILVLGGRGPKSPGTNPIGMQCDGTRHTFVNPDANAISASTTSSTLARFALDGTTVPGNARAIYLRLHGEFQLPAPAAGAEGVGYVDGLVTVTDWASNNSEAVSVGVEAETHTCVDSDPGGMGSTPGVNFKRQFVVRIPLQPVTFPQGSTQRTFNVTWTHNAGGSVTLSNFSMTVVGWELGP